MLQLKSNWTIYFWQSIILRPVRELSLHPVGTYFINPIIASLKSIDYTHKFLR